MIEIVEKVLGGHAILCSIVNVVVDLYCASKEVGLGISVILAVWERLKCLVDLRYDNEKRSGNGALLNI